MAHQPGVTVGNRAHALAYGGSNPPLRETKIRIVMKSGIHPKYVSANIRCACGSTFETLSTRPSISVEICSQCHPFFTGKQKIVDTEGRVDKFMQRFQKAQKIQAQQAARTKK